MSDIKDRPNGQISLDDFIVVQSESSGLGEEKKIRLKDAISKSVNNSQTVKLVPKASLGTLLCDHVGGNNLFDPSASAKAVVVTGTKTSKRGAAPVVIPADLSASNYIKLTGLGTDTRCQATALFSVNSALTPVVDTNITNIGFTLRAMPRADGEPFGSILIFVGQKAAANNGLDYAQNYYIWRMAVPCDGVERFYTINPDEATSSVVGVNFNRAQSLGGILFRLVTNGSSDWCKEPRNIANNKFYGANDSVYIGPIYYNCRGLSKGIIRFDDNLNGTLLGTYKGIVNPSAVTDYLPQLTSTAFNGALAFVNDSYETGIAFKGKSGIKIANNADHSFAELIKLFGFKASSFIITSKVGAPNFLTVTQLKQLRDQYGWLIAYQTHCNPLSGYGQGAKMLGPQGYNVCGTKYTSRAACAVPVVTAVTTWSGKPTLALVNIAVTTGDSNAGAANAALQGYSCYFVASADLPAALTPGVKYWLRHWNIVDSGNDRTLNVTVHNTEEEASTGTNPIDVVTGYAGVAGNIAFRFYNSTNDHQGILADYVNGKNWFIQNGFGDAYRTYAPNQGALDKWCEIAIEAFGEFDHIYNFGNLTRYLDVSFATCANQSDAKQQTFGNPDKEFITRDELITTTSIPTDNSNHLYSCTAATTGVVSLSGTLPADLYVQDGETLYFTAATGGAGITTGLNNVYFAVQSTGSTFKLSLTKDGAPIAITTAYTAGTVQLAETVIRQRVRNAVMNGAVIQDLTHDPVGVLAIREKVFYMDECKYWVNQGMLIIDTADVIGDMVLSERLGNIN